MAEVLADALVDTGPVELPRGRAIRRVALGGLLSELPVAGPPRSTVARGFAAVLPRDAGRRLAGQAPGQPLMPPRPTFDALVAAAMDVPLRGWDFGWLAGRAIGSDPTWSYPQLARAALDRSSRVLDIDTGGGELLASLVPLPAHPVATESWPPNLPIARERLLPLGVQVLPAPPDAPLPVPDEGVDLVLSRHGRITPAEVRRVLIPGGTLLTQQVGSEDCAELNTALGAAPAQRPGSWTLREASTALTAAGFQIETAREEWPLYTFADIGAVIYQLRMVPWQILDFTVDHYDAGLRRIDARIRADGPFRVHSHRFLLTATRSI